MEAHTEVEFHLISFKLEWNTKTSQIINYAFSSLTRNLQRVDEQEDVERGLVMDRILHTRAKTRKLHSTTAHSSFNKKTNEQTLQEVVTGHVNLLVVLGVQVDFATMHITDSRA